MLLRLLHDLCNAIRNGVDPAGHVCEGLDYSLIKILRGASDREGPWPRLSVWHGGADKIVSAENAEAILAQWRGVHGFAAAPTNVERIDGAERRRWQDAEGLVRLEAYVMPGMGHGTPLKTEGAGALGTAAPFMLDVGISSTARIAEFWGISNAGKPSGVAVEMGDVATKSPALVEPRRLYGRTVEPVANRATQGVARVIEDALRAAGLMK